MDGAVFLSCCFLVWGIHHWILLAVGWCCILVLRWRSPGELMPINIPWDREFFGIQVSWTQPSYPRCSGLTPGQGTMTLQVSWCGQRKKKKKRRRKERRQTKPKTSAFWFLPWTIDCLIAYYLASTCLCFLKLFFLLLISNPIVLWSEKMLDIISILLNFWRLAFWHRTWSNMENVPCALEKNVYSAAFEWNVF